MVSARCKMAVKEELKKLGLHFIIVDLGEVEIMEDISEEQRAQLKIAFIDLGFELMDDKKAVLLQQIKNIIYETVLHPDTNLKINFSGHLSKIIGHDYTYLANLFSEMQGTTIEQFMINYKIARVKELMITSELNMTEISWKLNYSSVAHLSTQFKKVTGLSPSQFRLLNEKRRITFEENRLPTLLGTIVTN